MFSLRTWFKKLSCKFNCDLLIVAPLVSFRGPLHLAPAHLLHEKQPPTLKQPRREAGRRTQAGWWMWGQLRLLSSNTGTSIAHALREGKSQKANRKTTGWHRPALAGTFAVCLLTFYFAP